MRILADFDRESMMEMFNFEMSQLVEQLEQTIIQAESGYAMEQINEVFRIMHTIKGASAMMLFENIAAAAHSIEDLFYYLREENPQNIDYSTLTDFVLAAMDFIKVELDKIQQGMPNDGDGSTVIRNITNYLKQLKGTDTAVSGGASGAPSTAEVPVGIAVADVPAGSLARYKAVIFFEEGCEMENVRAYTLLHNIKDQIARVIHWPENIIDQAAIEQIRDSGFAFECDCTMSYQQFHDHLSKTIYLRELNLQVLRPADENASRAPLVPPPAPPLNAQSYTASYDADDRDDVYKYEAFIRFEKGAEMENVRAYALVYNLEDYASEISYSPSDIVSELSIEEIRENGFTVWFESDKCYNDMHAILNNTIYLKELKLKNVETLQPAAPQGQAAQLQNVMAQLPEAALQSAMAPPQSVEAYAEPNVPDIDTFNNYDTEVKTMDTAVVPAAGVTEQPATKKSPPQSVISVSVSKLDQLLNLMGELVIAESMVTQNKDLDNLELENFHKEALQLRKIISDVQDNVMSMRMVQLSATFFKMHRIVRDMCKQLNKDVDLKVIGEETEVDKNIIEHIADPFMHIIRNSIDHGIELPDVRTEIGKPKKGTVTLEAKNAGGDVLIIISDDGAGLKKEKIIKKASQNGLLRKHESEYTDKEIYQFIFLPGFSTNEAVTAFSGRGVGMDVVSTNLEIVGGSVIVDSTPGEGSRFTLKIPLTLAIIDGMIVKLGDAKYTIPIINIQQSFKAKPGSIFIDPSGNEMIMVRGEVYNLIRLYEFFNVETAITEPEDGIVIMVENGEQIICILVDELIGQQPIVVKTLPKYFKKIRGISTCTLLGNGEISLIIDTVGFFDK